MTTVLFVILLFYTAYKEFMWYRKEEQWRKERQEFCDRLMARSLSDYRREEGGPPKAPRNKFIEILHKKDKKEGGEGD